MCLLAELPTAKIRRRFPYFQIFFLFGCLSDDCDGDCFGVFPRGGDHTELGHTPHPLTDEGCVVVATFGAPQAQVSVREHVVVGLNERHELREYVRREAEPLQFSVGVLAESRDGCAPAVAQVIGVCHGFVFQLLMVSMMRATMASTGEAIMHPTPHHVRWSAWSMAPIMRSVKPMTMANMDAMAMFSW